MFELLQDKYLLLPFVKKTDGLYTNFNFTPNQITLFNSFVITTIILYFWALNNFILALPFLFIRNLLDGADGYIARKYKITSHVGNIYDHMSDSTFICFFGIIALYKLNTPLYIIISLSNIIVMMMMLFNFSENLGWISKVTFGAGGSYNSYCTLFYIIAHFTLVIISYNN